MPFPPALLPPVPRAEYPRVLCYVALGWGYVSDHLPEQNTDNGPVDCGHLEAIDERRTVDITPGLECWSLHGPAIRSRVR